jgi:hypothetical protein
MRLVLACLVLAACAASTITREPAIVSYDTSARADAWPRVVALVQAKGYVITLLDQPSGAITTAPAIRDARCGRGRCRVRDTLSLAVSPSGEIIVNIIRETDDGLYDPEWTETQDPDLVRAVMAEQDQIAQEIAAIIGDAGGGAGAAGPPGRATGD